MRQLADRARIERFMRALASQIRSVTRVYFAGGTTAVLFGWRQTTIDVDLKIVPDSDEALRAIPQLKERLAINVELAVPSDFMPVADDWQERSPFVAQFDSTSFYHFDLYAQALAKIERGHPQDIGDVRAMLERGLVDGPKMKAYFDRIEPRLYRYPSLDPRAFRQAVVCELERSDRCE